MNIRLMLSLIPKIEVYNKNAKRFKCTGLSISQIEYLENYYYPKENKQFPLALREMLYLFGGSYVFDTGCKLNSNEEGTKDLGILLKSQNKKWLSDKQKQYFINNRPIWVFNNHEDTEHYEDFSFVYLDEEDENPLVWRFLLNPCYEQLFIQNAGRDENGWNFVEKIRLVEYVKEILENEYY